MKKTGKPIAAGILCIITGALNIFLGILAVNSLSSTGYYENWIWQIIIPEIYETLEMLMTLSQLVILAGLVSLVGGIFALLRKAWGVALAGAIFALFPPPAIILGILSIVFIAMSKKEFGRDQDIPQTL